LRWFLAATCYDEQDAEYDAYYVENGVVYASVDFHFESG